VAESLGEAIEEAARGDSKSAVSRRFVNATAAKLDELVHRDLSTLDVAVLMIDGIVFAKCCCVVAIVVTTDGTKVSVGLFEGDTENATVVTDLLADLVERGLDATKGILCVLDGSKALASGVRQVFGKQALVQRCTIHKRRNVSDYLPKELAQATDDKLARAFNDADTARGLKVAKGVAAQAGAPAPVSCRQHPRGPGGDVHRPPARRPRPAGTHHDHYERRRVDDLGREVARRAGEELARRHDGAAPGRDRHVGGRAFLPPREGL
jgi:hypothetical protein